MARRSSRMAAPRCSSWPGWRFRVTSSAASWSDQRASAEADGAKLTAAIRITHDPNGRRSAPAAWQKARTSVVVELSRRRSGGFGPGERSAPLLRACELRYFVADDGWIGRPNGKYRFTRINSISGCRRRILCPGQLQHLRAAFWIGSARVAGLTVNMGNVARMGANPGVERCASS